MSKRTNRKLPDDVRVELTDKAPGGNAPLGRFARWTAIKRSGARTVREVGIAMRAIEWPGSVTSMLLKFQEHGYLLLHGWPRKE